MLISDSIVNNTARIQMYMCNTYFIVLILAIYMKYFNPPFSCIYNGNFTEI